MTTSFIICSRADSRRVPRKAFAVINGRPLIEHLIRRCNATGYPVILAIPHRDIEEYRYLKDLFDVKDLQLFCGNAEDPLGRMQKAAEAHDVETIIRVSHDKLFVDPGAVREMVSEFERLDLDYAFSSSFMPGASMEVISRLALDRAAAKFRNVEFIGYAVRCVTDQIKDIPVTCLPKSDHRLLVDYPEDVKVLDLVLHSTSNECSLTEAVQFLDQHQWISRINRPPKTTIYTCAHNAEKWITKAMGTVARQSGFANSEYILIDDCSTDSTPVLMSKFCGTFKNARMIRNQKNIGLASSSNIALKEARGRWIVRLDADDYFIGDDVIDQLVAQAEISGSDVVYPDNYFGSFGRVQRGEECHHVGGALFSTRAANHVKFTDGLRGYEGLDLFHRAREVLRIAYLHKPMFFYRQHDGSLSKSNPEKRQKIFEQVMKNAATPTESRKP